MSQENVEEVSPELFAAFRASYDALSRGESETWLRSLHDEVEIRQSPRSPWLPGTTGTFRGKAGALALIDEIAESFGELDWNPQRVYDLGRERYLVLLLPKGRGTSSGIKVQTELGHLIQLRDGRTYRIETYLGWSRALEAVGLSE